MILAALTCFSLASLPAAHQESASEPLHLVRVEIGAERHDLDDLAARGIDVTHMHFGSAHDAGHAHRTAEFVLSSKDLEGLREDGWSAELVIEDLEQYYANRLATGYEAFLGTTYGSWLSPPFAQGTMSGYYSVTQIGSVLDQIASAYPNIVTPKAAIGQSLEGRDLWMVKVSDNPGIDENEPEVRIDAMHHAREPQGMQTTLWFLLWLCEEYGSDPLATYLVDEREIYIIPCVNPDGYTYNEQQSPQGGGMWRKNRRNNGGGSFGVDLNRNYDFQWGYDDLGSSSDPNSDVYRGPSAASEPEVQALMAFMATRDFKTTLSVHTFGNWWLSPLGYIEAAPANGADYDEVGALATEVNGYAFGPASILLYLANGTTVDYDHGAHGSMSWTPEIGNGNDGFWPPQSRIVPLAEENLLALARTALAAGPYLHVQDVTATELLGDFDDDFEGGETLALDVSLRNSGLAASGAVNVQVTSLSTQLVVVNGTGSAASVASFASGSTTSDPSLRILPGTPTGIYAYELTITAGGFQGTASGEIVVGSEVVVASYDFEAGGTQGWSVGSPNDASTGTWERGNPIGTEAQTEDDHTPGQGNNTCWFTGQGSNGGSVGENDVDGGTTTVLSPIFDLDGASAATIRYWRWYSNDAGSAPNADVFEIDLSNDGGSSWTSAEVVGPSGAQTSGGWHEATIHPESVLPLTSQMRMRFRASDLDSGSIVEAALDDFTVRYIEAGDCPAPELYCSTSPNSVGAGAVIATSGSTGVADNTFALHASGVPAGNFGLFFYGSAQNAVPLGEGTLCIAAPFTRLNVQQADGAGNVTHALSFGGGLTAGTNWNFQFWYRDPAGGPVGFNLSDAVSVSFCD